MCRLSHVFSENNILVQSIKLSEIQNYVKYYKYRTLLPLYIITLKTQLDLVEFSNFTKNFRMSRNLWLVFFYKSKDLLRYCHKPDKNHFNVAFDTKLLVKCEDDIVIREWYSLPGKEVKMNKIAIWTRLNGFVKIDSRSIWERRNTLDGITITVSSVKVNFYLKNKPSSQYNSLE